MTELYFSRLTLKRDPANAALKNLIDPPGTGRKTDAHHRLLWTLFADGPDRDRDFLWRAEKRGCFYVLSHRRPQPHGLFEEPEVKPFEPALSPGDRLSFLLRANAVTQRPKNPNDRSPPSEKHPQGRVRSRKVDVAMDLLKDVPGRGDLAKYAPSRRAPQRHEIAQKASGDWLARQGAAHGFSVRNAVLETYGTITLPGYRGKRDKEPRFGVFDIEGEIAITDPAAFVMGLAAGFGRAKAYGCGLMMIRRA